MKPMKLPLLAAALLLTTVAAASAQQNAVTNTLTVTVSPAVVPLAMVLNPSNPTVACVIPAGTLVSTVTVGGGNGAPITLSPPASPDGSLVLSSTTPPANVVVGPSGINSGDCGSVLSYAITATQPILAGSSRRH